LKGRDRDRDRDMDRDRDKGREALVLVLVPGRVLVTVVLAVAVAVVATGRLRGGESSPMLFLLFLVHASCGVHCDGGIMGSAKGLGVVGFGLAGMGYESFFRTRSRGYRVCIHGVQIANLGRGEKAPREVLH